MKVRNELKWSEITRNDQVMKIIKNDLKQPKTI